MNKKELINELTSRTDLSEKDCRIVFCIFERYLFWLKKNKNEIINDLLDELDVTKNKATDIYESALDVIKNGVKDSILHPFSSKD